MKTDKNNDFYEKLHGVFKNKDYYEKPLIGCVKLLADQVLGVTSGCLKTAADDPFVCGAAIENA